MTIDNQDNSGMITELKKASCILRNGGLVAFPTDTLYALSASIINQEAVNRVFDIKNRDPRKPLPIFTHNKSDVFKWSKNLCYKWRVG